MKLYNNLNPHIFIVSGFRSTKVIMAIQVSYVTNKVVINVYLNDLFAMCEKGSSLLSGPKLLIDQA